MSQQTSTVNPWSDDEKARFLHLRMKSFWNMDYFEKVILPLLDLPNNGYVLDVGCGNGGISSIPDICKKAVSPIVDFIHL
jgi:16S rRNA G1207 methylase RsmC